MKRPAAWLETAAALALGICVAMVWEVAPAPAGGEGVYVLSSGSALKSSPRSK